MTVLFSPQSSIDFEDVRSGVVRIPEVVRRLREAQDVCDQHLRGFNLHGFLSSENGVFLGNIRLKSLAAAVIQVGLFDRYLRQFGSPRFLVGAINGESSLRVCAGEMGLVQMILESSAVKGQVGCLHSSPNQPILEGISLEEYGVFEVGPDRAERLEIREPDLAKVVQKLIDDMGQVKFVNIGPGLSGIRQLHSSFALSDIQFIESIDIDPLLSWFWPGVSQNLRAV